MNTFISEQGRAALEKVANWLEAGAPHVDVDGRRLDQFNMNFAVYSGTCGTSCCVAGAVCQFEGLGTLNYDNGINYGGHGWGDSDPGAGSLAQDYLNISDDDARALFLPWEAVDTQKYPFLNNNATPFSVPAIAAKVIRVYLQTGVIDWIAAGVQTH